MTVGTTLFKVPITMGFLTILPRGHNGWATMSTPRKTAKPLSSSHVTKTARVAMIVK